MKILWFILAMLALLANSGSADLYTPPAANAVPTSGSTSQQEGYCNSVCSALVNTNGKVLGLNGSVGWSVADDLWCANHGSQTNPLVGAGAVPNAAPPPSGACPVTLVPGDTSCDQAVSMVAHCNWHNGQLEQQCEAYEAAGGSNSAEKIVLALDLAATGTCAVACATTTVSVGTSQAACTDVGLAASTTELIETLAQKSSPMAKAISGVMGVAGIVKSLYPFLKGGSAGSLFLGQSDQLPDLPQTTAQKIGGSSATTTTTPPAKTSKLKQASCQSAILFAAMSGMRYNNINSQESTQKSACSEVEQLASAAPTIGSGGVLIPATLSGGTGVTSGGGTGATELADGSSSLRCVGSGGSVSSCTGTSASSPDVAALDNSGLGQQVAPMAAQIANSPMSGGAGNAAGTAASAAGAPGDIAGAVSTVAATAQDQPQALFGKVGATDGGGGGGGDEPAAQPNPMAMLASLFGQGKSQRAPSAVGVNVYKGAPQSQDIYHTNSPDNLFQIISGRIQKDSARLQ